MTKSLKARPRFRARLEESWKGHKGIRDPRQRKPSRYCEPIAGLHLQYTLKDRTADSLKPGEFFILRQSHPMQDPWWAGYNGFLPFMEEVEGRLYDNPYKAFEALTKALGEIRPENLPKEAKAAKDEEWLLHDLFPIRGVKITIGVVDITAFKGMNMSNPLLCSAPAKGIN